MVCNGMGERITDKNLFEPGVWLTEFILKWCLTLEINIPRLFSLAGVNRQFQRFAWHQM